MHLLVQVLQALNPPKPSPATVALLLALVVGAAVYDIRYRRIPNWLNLSGFLLGLALNTFQYWNYWLDALNVGPGWLYSLTGFAVAFVIYIALRAIHAVGAGDVKLMGALGAWLGASVIFGVAFYTSLAGGILALVLIAKHRYGRQAVRNLLLLLTHWRVFGLRPLDALTLETSAGPKLPYALPIAAGVVLTRCLW